MLLVRNGENRELLGVGNDFFVVKDGSYFVTYDSDSRKIEMLDILPGMTFGAAIGSTSATSATPASAAK
jgi:hypothetical protein